MANNIVEFIIRIKENARKQTELVSNAFQKANQNAKKLAETSQKLPMTIADYRGELSSLEHKKTFAKTEAEIRNINGIITKTTRNLQRLENLPPNGFFSRLKKASQAITGLNFKDMGIAFVAMRAKSFVTESVKLYDIQKKAEAQLQATLESTGFTAGKTFNELTKQASALQKKTLFGDENIIKAQSLLLTFKSVRGVIFDQAMPAILDLSAKMDGDLPAAVNKVGKALEDPVKGLTSLRLVGVQFSKEQEEGIKKLVEAGKLEEAQLIILSELQSRFGGSAAAAAKEGLGPIQQLTNAWNDFREKIGGTALKITNTVVPTLQKTVEWADRNGHALKNLSKAVLVGAATWTSFKLAQMATLKVSALLKTSISVKTLAVNALTGGLKQAKVAMMAFNAATKANVIGLVVAGLVAVVSGFIAFRKRGKEATQTMNEARQAANSLYAQEKMQLDMIYAQLQKTNPKSKERKDLVKQLKDLYPDLNQQILDEITNTNNLSTAYGVLIQKISEKAKVKALEETMKGLYDQNAEIDNVINELVNFDVPRENFILNDGSFDQESYLKRWNEVQSSYRSSMESIFEGLEKGQLQTHVKKGNERVFHHLKKSGIIEDGYLKTFEAGLLGGTDVYFDKLSSYFGNLKKIESTRTSLANMQFSSGGTLTPPPPKTPPPTDALDSITGGGKSQKNFYINIGNILGENNNYFQSSGDNPESADGFMEKLSRAIQNVVNDINYSAG